MCAYNGVLRIIGQMHEELSVGGGALNKTLDMGTIIPEYDTRLTRYHDEWHARIEERRIPDGAFCRVESGCLLMGFRSGVRAAVCGPAFVSVLVSLRCPVTDPAM
jgi:hypothetical protein